MTSFMMQAGALLRKNLTCQRRNIKQNIALTILPAFFCLLIISIQSVINSQLDNPRYHCGCKCIPIEGNGTCHNVCGLEFSTPRQAIACPITRPQAWPLLMQVPKAQNRAVRTDAHTFPGLPDSSCLKNLSCPITSLFTGQNKVIAKSLVRRIFSNMIPANVADLSDFISLSYLGTSNTPDSTNYVENALVSHSPIYLILPKCFINFNLSVPVTMGNHTIQKEVHCIRSTFLWRDNSLTINKELFQGYSGGNPAHEIHELFGAYDFLNTSERNFHLHMWYNSTYSNLAKRPRVLRISRSLNMVSNAFLHQIKTRRMRILLSFVKEMPKQGAKVSLDLSVMLGPLLYAWVIQLLLPFFLIFLVYDKQQKCRSMMKVNGLGNGPYWLITYCYFLLVSSLYMIWFATIGSLVGLEIFKLNSYSIQLIFYTLYLNLQIALSFTVSIGLSEVQAAAAFGYIYVLASGLLGAFLFQNYIEDPIFPRRRLMIMEILPGFSLYRGLYELSQFALDGHYKGTSGINWQELINQNSGIKETMIIMTLEWLILLFISYHLEQVAYRWNGAHIPRNLRSGSIEPAVSNRTLHSTIIADHENSNVDKEVQKVEHLLSVSSRNHPIICWNLDKVYYGKDGNPNKHAIHSLSLAVGQGECLGILGPNGSGKTTLINIVTGLLPPTSGTVFINSKDIKSNRDMMCSKIGVCPQKDLIWEFLTGREHLVFYGRLRNLRGTSLQYAVDDTLKSLDLYEGNVSNQLAGKYSGGMKRRLSVAISLIGDTQAVFLDEPTTGLDPVSKYQLWQAIKLAKRDRAMILTTHSMEEAELLCDRVGIVINGRLQCLGTANELICPSA
ncbi:ABC transporter A family member 7-like isoform X2 [Typha angustifolia]|uniref:ABC transporter A family member 7-like isoform X2 n=1 Tax=Typha angustifolia TaxID=59011 RepID=UPI003C2DC167